MSVVAVTVANKNIINALIIVVVVTVVAVTIANENIINALIVVGVVVTVVPKRWKNSLVKGFCVFQTLFFSSKNDERNY